MSHDERGLAAQLSEILTHQRYNPVVVHNLRGDYFPTGPTRKSTMPSSSSRCRAG